jgi:hypothetical protein
MVCTPNVLILRGESRKPNFVRGKSKRNFFQEDNPKVAYFAGYGDIFVFF